jgi:ABC-type phosphate transport system auxiliary subunit
VLIDGESLEEVDFAEEVAGSLGAFATANQFSVGNLKERLKKKDLQISQLHNQMKTVEKNFRSEVNKGFEQIRASDKQEIQKLKSNLKEMHRDIQASQG